MEIDDKSWRLLVAIQQDARMPLKALAEVVGLSLPATSERLKRLEDAGVVRAWRAEVEPEKVGYSVLAIIGMTTPQPQKNRLLALLDAMPEVLECLHVTGQDSFLLRVAARDIRHLESLVGRINIYGETRTSIVMSSPIPLRGVQRPQPHSA